MNEDLVAFLRARLDAEHMLATRLKSRFTTRGEYTDTPGQPYWPTPHIRAASRAYGDPEVALQADLIEMFTPDRVLAEVDAKRRIIEEHRPSVERKSWAEDWTICGTCRYDGGLDTYPFPCPTLRLLALPYADHPDYREEWRP